MIDHWGQLNVECDGLAKIYWNTNALARRARDPIYSSDSKNGLCGSIRKSFLKSTRKSCMPLLSPNAPRPMASQT